MHHASPFGLDSKVRSAALRVGDTSSLAKLSAGDVVAIEMKSNLKYLASLYNLARAMESQQSLEDQQKNLLRTIAFAEFET